MADGEKSRGVLGFLSRVGMMFLFLVMAFLGLHVYFIWQPVGLSDVFSQAVMKAKIGDVKIFPAIEDYDLSKMDGRSEILEGKKFPNSPLPARLGTAIDRNTPVTFTETEVNVWLRNRLQVKQGGFFAPDMKVKGVWVHFTPGEVEIMIERWVPEQKATYVVSLYMQFETTKNGFSIHRHAAHVGQVKLPGGFARLVMPSFNLMAEALSKELMLYKDDSKTSDKALKIHAIRVEEGQITLDPRLPSLYQK